MKYKINKLYDIDNNLNDAVNAGIAEKTNMITECKEKIQNNWINKLDDRSNDDKAEIIDKFLNSDAGREEKYQFIANLYGWNPLYAQSTQQENAAAALSKLGLPNPFVSTSSSDNKEFMYDSCLTDDKRSGWSNITKWMDEQTGPIPSGLDVPVNKDVKRCPCFDCLTSSEKQNLIKYNLEGDINDQIEECKKNINDNSEEYIEEGKEWLEKIDDVRAKIIEDEPDKFKMIYNDAILASDNLQNKLTTSKLLHEESINVRKNLENVSGLSVEKIRMAEINTYYAQKYRLQLKIVKLCILFGIILMILIVINKMLYMPNFIYNILRLTILILAGYYIIPAIYDYNRRDNIMFQQYDWSGYNPAVEPSKTKVDKVETTPSPLVTCAPSVKDDDDDDEGIYNTSKKIVGEIAGYKK